KTVDFTPGLVHRDARSHAPDHLQKVKIVADQQIGREIRQYGSPDFHAAVREHEPARHHGYDFEVLRIDLDLFADDVRRAPEALLPQAVADRDHVRSAIAVF